MIFTMVSGPNMQTYISTMDTFCDPPYPETIVNTMQKTEHHQKHVKKQLRGHVCMEECGKYASQGRLETGMGMATTRSNPSSPQDSSTSLLLHSWGRLGVPSCGIYYRGSPLGGRLLPRRFLPGNTHFHKAILC